MLKQIGVSARCREEKKPSTLLGCRSDTEIVICTAVRNFVSNLSFSNLLTLLNLFA